MEVDQVAFTMADRREAESLLSKLTTTLDAVGKSHRDIVLVLRLNPHWAGPLTVSLGGYAAALQLLLTQASAMELEIADRLNEVHPPGE